MQLQLRQVPEALKIEGRQNDLRRRKGLRRAMARRLRCAGNQFLAAQPDQQIADDLFAEDLGQADTVPLSRRNRGGL